MYHSLVKGLLLIEYTSIGGSDHSADKVCVHVCMRACVWVGGVSVGVNARVSFCSYIS